MEAFYPPRSFLIFWVALMPTFHRATVPAPRFLGMIVLTPYKSAFRKIFSRAPLFSPRLPVFLFKPSSLCIKRLTPILHLTSTFPSFRTEFEPRFPTNTSHSRSRNRLHVLCPLPARAFSSVGPVRARRPSKRPSMLAFPNSFVSKGLVTNTFPATHPPFAPRFFPLFCDPAISLVATAPPVCWQSFRSFLGFLYPFPRKPGLFFPRVAGDLLIAVLLFTFFTLGSPFFRARIVFFPPPLYVFCLSFTRVLFFPTSPPLSFYLSHSLFPFSSVRLKDFCVLPFFILFFFPRDFLRPRVCFLNDGL